MKAVVYHGLGDIRLDSVGDPKLKEDTDALVPSAIDAYKAFDERQQGWLKVELTPGL